MNRKTHFNDYILRTYSHIILFVLILMTGLFLELLGQNINQKQIENNFQKEIRKIVSARYLLYLPKGYNDTPQKQWPLILFLHGSGERGTDIELVKRHGPPKLVEEGMEFESIIVSPQCPEYQEWSVDVIDALLTHIVEQYRVDTNRIHLTGLSMGATGVWDLAFAFPNRFSSIVPICGRVSRNHPPRANLIKHLPIWVFHGEKDDVVPLSDSQRMVDSLQNYGADVRFTIYPETRHDAWTETYNNPEL